VCKRCDCRVGRQVAMRTRRFDLNDEPEYPETVSLGSWSWRSTGSVFATESSNRRRLGRPFEVAGRHTLVIMTDESAA